MYKFSRASAFLAACLSFSINTAYGWGGRTHKAIAQNAVAFLDDQDPVLRQEKEFYQDHIKDLLFGVVDADRYSRLHRISFSYEDGSVEEDPLAVFGEDAAEKAIKIIRDARMSGQVTEEDKKTFARLAGYAVHAVSDAFQPLHTTDDETKAVHKELEDEVDKEIKNGERKGVTCFVMRPDGTLREDIDVYNETIRAARLSHFGRGSVISAEDVETEVPLGRRGNGSYIGIKKWPKELKKTIELLLSRAANVSEEVLNYMYQRAFIDSVDEETNQSSSRKVS